MSRDQLAVDQGRPRKLQHAEQIVIRATLHPCFPGIWCTSHSIPHNSNAQALHSYNCFRRKKKPAGHIPTRGLEQCRQLYDPPRMMPLTLIISSLGQALTFFVRSLGCPFVFLWYDAFRSQIRSLHFTRLTGPPFPGLGLWRNMYTSICCDCNCCAHSRTVGHELASVLDLWRARRWLATTVAVKQHRAVGNMHRHPPGIKARRRG